MQKKEQQIDAAVIKIRYKHAPKQLNLSRYKDIWERILVQKQWSMLRSLVLANCNITDDSIQVLLKLELPNLIKIGLWDNNISSQGIKILSTKKWDQLQSIRLNSNNIKDQSLYFILYQMLNPTKLTCLGISQCGITWKGIQLMTGFQFCMLKELWISNNAIGNRGIKFLTKINLPHLKTLQMDNCLMGLQGFKHFTKCYLPVLSRLDINWNFDDLNSNLIHLGGWEIMYTCYFRKNQLLKEDNKEYGGQDSILQVGMTEFEQQITKNQKKNQPKLNPLEPLQMYIIQIQPIFWINTALIHHSTIRFSRNFVCFQGKNQDMKNCLQEILKKKQLFMN